MLMACAVDEKWIAQAEITYKVICVALTVSGYSVPKKIKLSQNTTVPESLPCKRNLPPKK